MSTLKIVPVLALSSALSLSSACSTEEGALSDLVLRSGTLSISISISIDNDGEKTDNSEMRIGDEITLTPAFRDSVTSYAATIPYNVSAFSVIASTRHPGASVTATASAADGTPLSGGITTGAIDGTTNDGEEVRGDYLVSFSEVPLGQNTVTVEVTNEDDGSVAKPTVLTVVRLDVDMDDEEQRELFFRNSVANGDVEGVTRAISAGVDPSARNEPDGVSSLIAASSAGHVAIVRLLIDAGADVNYTLPAPESGPGSNNAMAGASALHLVAFGSEEHEEIVRLLLEAGANVNETLPDWDIATTPVANSNLSGLSPLMLASNRGHEEIVGLLIGAGANVNYRVLGERNGQKNPQTAGLTALRAATGGGHSGVITLLQEEGAQR